MPLSLTDIAQLRALVIEDNIDDYTLLIDHLESYDVKVIAQRVDNEAALTTALSQPWNVIFSDFSMPKLNGLKALQIVREHDLDIPFIYFSGTIGEATAVEAMRAGAQDYVMKSDIARLVPTIERELQEVINRREQREVNKMLRKMSLAITQAADSVLIMDADGKIEYANPAFERLTGYTMEEIIGKRPSQFSLDDFDQTERDKLWKFISEGNVFSGILINQRKDGSAFQEEKVISPLYDENGCVTHYVATGRDITERMQAEASRNRLNNVIESTSDLVAIVRTDGSFLHLNRAGYEMLGLDPDDSLKKETLGLVIPDTLAEQLELQIFPNALSEGHWQGEVWLKQETITSAGLPVSLVVLAHTENNSAPYLSLIARDISERKKFEAQLQHQATHDSLTQLPNRYFLIDRLQTAIHIAHRRKTSLAILFLDIDKFKRVNDNLGHTAGDSLLRKVAHSLQGCLRPSDTIARLGGDEFTVLIEDIKDPEDTFIVLKKIFEVFKHPINIETQEIFASFSVGIALYPQDASNEIDLLRLADIAMYRAKHKGSNQYQFYTEDMDTRGRELLAIDTELRYAIANNELCLFYQPKIDITTGAMIGVESLLRWRSPKRGLVSPLDFVPLLESSGLIVSVGEWILQEACLQYQHFCEIGRPDISISVNVSAVQLQDAAFQDKVAAIVQQFNIPPAMLELEITENIVMQDPVRAAAVLVALSKIGVHTAIDDFGTGYSSLAYLKRFPVNTLKIDKSFIDDILKDSSDAAIVEASITIAHKLGMKVVAEGVETLEQLVFLDNQNCDIAQGYFFSKPIPANEILDFEPQS